MSSDRAVTAPVRLGHQPALDGLRGIAVLLVVINHAANALWPEARPWMLRGGAFGADLFFVLSGFLITSLLLGEASREGGIRLPDFFRRRALRLVPVIVALYATFLALALALDRDSLRERAESAVYALSFTLNLSNSGRHIPIITDLIGPAPALSSLGHLWTICVEVHFYVLWGLSLWLMTRARWSYRRMALLATAVIAAVAIARFLAVEGGTSWLLLYERTSARMDAPIVGSLFGIAFVSGALHRLPRRIVVRAGVAGLAGVLLMAATIDLSRLILFQGLFTVLAMLGAAAVASSATVPTSIFARALAWRRLTYIGTLSYSIYIWHQPIFVLLRDWQPTWQGAAPVALGMAATAAASVVSFNLVEQPFMNRRNRRRPTLEGPPASTRPHPERQS